MSVRNPKVAPLAVALAGGVALALVGVGLAAAGAGVACTATAPAEPRPDEAPVRHRREVSGELLLAADGRPAGTRLDPLPESERMVLP